MAHVAKLPGAPDDSVRQEPSGQETSAQSAPGEGKSLADIIAKHFGAVRDEIERLGITEEEIAADVAQALKEVRAERRAERERVERERVA